MVFKSYLVDAIALKDLVADYMADFMENTSLLKIVDDQSTVTKLHEEFDCYPLNVILSSRPLEKADYSSSVLSQQDYRVRPMTSEQYQLICQQQIQFMRRVCTQPSSLLLQMTDIDLFEESKRLSLLQLDPNQEVTMAPQKTFRGQLQRWRDQTAQKYDEGAQFVLEDNLLNHLLEQSDTAQSRISGQWILQQC